MVSSADSNQWSVLRCCLRESSASPGICSTEAALAWPRPPTRQTVCCFALPGWSTQSCSMKGRRSRTLYVCLRTLRPGPRSCGVDVFRSGVGSGWILTRIPRGYPQPLRSARCRMRTAFISSAMAFPALPFSLVIPDDPRPERTLCPANNFDSTPGGGEVQAAETRPPEKAIGPSPLPGRWPSAPNGQSLASRMGSLCRWLSREPALRGTRPVGGHTSCRVRLQPKKSEHPSLGTLARRTPNLECCWYSNRRTKPQIADFLRERGCPYPSSHQNMEVCGSWHPVFGIPAPRRHAACRIDHPRALSYNRA
jgi:hypothetical protein